MILTLVKETHPESRNVRYSVEKNGQFIDGTLMINEEAARRMYNAAKRSGGNSIWEKEIVETTETN
jgi:hypothetical protein